MRDLRELRDAALSKNIQIDEVTVSPVCYEMLMDEVVGNHEWAKTDSNHKLIFRGIVVNKRECEGCCIHKNV